MPEFCHLHTHTQFSLLDGATRIKGLMSKAKDFGMPALAITDHGNLFGVPRFVVEANKQGIKPIVGCEFYVTPTEMADHKEKTRYHQVLLAKNQIGYQNICKLSSLSYVEGFYYKPRTDKETIRKYKEGIIATTCCIAGEVPKTILNKGEAEGEKVFLEWLEIFGDDYYVELQRHGIPEQDTVNVVLLKFAEKYGVKIICTNDIHYLEQKDSKAQDILLRLQMGLNIDDHNKLSFNDQFYMKSGEEMAKLFKDVPSSIENTLQLISKIETPKLTRDILLPIFSLPEGFNTENDYLRFLSEEGAKKRFGELDSVVNERLNFELSVIKDMGFAGYFLIVQDFIHAAKKLEVAVGPGRGSAAGSLIAYCTGITNIDPIQYNLLFERFLNPERVSMPDIDIDFDDEGRQKVIDYVVDKYGKNQVAQIVTFGTMAARSSIRDVARVLKLPLQEADKLAKLVPDVPGTTLEKTFKEVKDFKPYLTGDNELIKQTLTFAETLEGSVRHTGLHAAGIIIAPDDLSKYIPICISKDADLLVTQYDGKHIESVGMLKMDFLGLKTLSIIKDALELIHLNHNELIDIDKIPLDDPKAFELFKKGETIGVFQFESAAMRKHLIELQPTNIEDLIAMNALYRPGPMDSIPNYINRKNGKEAIEYAHEFVKELLEVTFGVIVYQEQVMLIVQKLAGFTKGQADTLRKAMSKKDMILLEKQRAMFVEGAAKNGVETKVASDLFNKMAKFGEYGFNRSHSAAYSVLAYQTGYLKANYLSEYMAAVLTHNMNEIKKVTFFMAECKALNIPIYNPDINESLLKFAASKTGHIRFGLGAIKGIGTIAVKAIIKEREENGPFEDFFDFVKRINLRVVNKKCIESLAYAGAFDNFNIKRSRYFHIIPGETQNLIEKAILFGNHIQGQNKVIQPSLFGDDISVEPQPPQIPECEPFDQMTRLQQEKEYIGFYISGHPLDSFKLEIDHFCNTNSDSLSEAQIKDISIAGMVTSVSVRSDRRGNEFGSYILEDFAGTFAFALFNEDYLKFKHFFEKGKFLYLKGKSQLKYRSEDQYEFRPNQILLLCDVLEKFTSRLDIYADLSKLNTKTISDLESIVEDFPGNCVLKLILREQQSNMSVDMLSKKYKIKPVKEFLNDLSKIEDLKFKLN